MPNQLNGSGDTDDIIIRDQRKRIAMNALLWALKTSLKASTITKIIGSAIKDQFGQEKFFRFFAHVVANKPYHKAYCIAMHPDENIPELESFEKGIKFYVQVLMAVGIVSNYMIYITKVERNLQHMGATASFRIYNLLCDPDRPQSQEQQDHAPWRTDIIRKHGLLSAVVLGIVFTSIGGLQYFSFSNTIYGMTKSLCLLTGDKPDSLIPTLIAVGNLLNWLGFNFGPAYDNSLDIIQQIGKAHEHHKGNVRSMIRALWRKIKSKKLFVFCSSVTLYAIATYNLFYEIDKGSPLSRQLLSPLFMCISSAVTRVPSLAKKRLTDLIPSKGFLHTYRQSQDSHDDVGSVNIGLIGRARQFIHALDRGFIKIIELSMMLDCFHSNALFIFTSYKAWELMGIISNDATRFKVVLGTIGPVIALTNGWMNWNYKFKNARPKKGTKGIISQFGNVIWLSTRAKTHDIYSARRGVAHNEDYSYPYQESFANAFGENRFLFETETGEDGKARPYLLATENDLYQETSFAGNTPTSSLAFASPWYSSEIDSTADLAW